MKILRKTLFRRSAKAKSANTGLGRMNKSMPGEAAAIASVRLGCMSL